MADIDTLNINNNFHIPDFDFKGIPKIKIPKRDSDFAGEDLGINIIAKYLPRILSQHKKNASKIEYLYKYYQGQQDIYSKIRLREKDQSNNNMVVENHASRQVDFKVGFLTSEHREYTAKTRFKGNENVLNDLAVLSDYFTDCDFFGKDKEVKEWVYAVGVGVFKCYPRTDIIVGEDKNAIIREDFDIESEAPFYLEAVSPINNFLVYSDNNIPLFCVSIVEVEKDINSSNLRFEKEIYIETRYATFVTNSNLSFGGIKEIRLKSEKSPYNYLPMIEQWANTSRIGIVELNRDLFNIINTIISCVSDMIVDNANMIYVFQGTDITGEEVKDMIKAGAIVLPPPQQTGQTPSVSTISIQIPFDGLNEFYLQRVEKAYDIAGVPLASGQVTSGGDTGQARLLGGGWNNAYTISKNEINSFLYADNSLLKLILYICKLFNTCPIKTIKASNIEIKYRINQSDNFLVKAQGIAQLYSTNMPKELILKFSGISSDIGTDATVWENYETEKNKSQQSTKETMNVEETATDNDKNKNDNSQE